jgi:phosphohistidine phosphatase
VKSLYLVRHAKSSWKDISLQDFDRPLNKRGFADAPFMAEVLKQKDVKLDAIICSPAMRTKTTAELIAPYLGFPMKNIVYHKQMYETSEKTLLKLLKEIPNTINNLMFVGHNPSLTALANLLADSYVYNIPTTGIYAIQFDCLAWDNIGNTKGEFMFFEYPKKYKI